MLPAKVQSLRHFRSARMIPSVALLILCLLPLLFLAFSRILLIDDAFITYRYAYHLGAGNGLVFNPGERVEGSTSLLWTLLTATLIALDWPIHRWVVGIGFGCALLALLTVGQIFRRLGLPARATLPALAALACCPGYWLVATNGMEGGLTTLLLTQSILLTVAHRPTWAGICGGLLFMTRPDSAAVLPLCALYALGTAHVNWRRILLRHTLPMLLPWAMIVGGVTLWRFAYYGAWVPNTVTAKSPPNFSPDLLGSNALEGLRYCGAFLVESTPLVLGALLGLLFSPRRAIVWLCTGLLTLQIPAILINGGDWIPHYRLLMVYAPVLAVMLALAVEWLANMVAQDARWYRRAFRWGACLLLIATIALPLRANRWEPSPGVRINQQGVICTDYQALALALRPMLVPDDRLAPEALGIFSYILRDTYAHDFLGLTDRYLARNGKSYWPQIGKSDLGYTYSVIRPTLFIFHSGIGFPNDLYYSTAGRFDSEYVAYILRGLKSCPPGTTILVIRRDSLDRLLPAVARFAPQPLLLGAP